LADYKHFRENDSSGIIDSYTGYDRPQTAHIAANIIKVKDRFFDQCL